MVEDGLVCNQLWRWTVEKIIDRAVTTSLLIASLGLAVLGVGTLCFQLDSWLKVVVVLGICLFVTIIVIALLLFIFNVIREVGKQDNTPPPEDTSLQKMQAKALNRLLSHYRVGATDKVKIVVVEGVGEGENE